MKIEIKDINKETHVCEFDGNLDQLKTTIQFEASNGFILTHDGTHVMISKIVTFKVME